MKMRPLTLLILITAVSLLLTLAPSSRRSTAAHPRSTTIAPPVAAARTSRRTLLIENVGQFDADVRFQMPQGNHTLWLTEDALWITAQDGASGIQNQKSVALKLSFPGANPHPRITPYRRADTRVNYLTGDDPGRWHTDVPAWGGVRYADLFPGVDLVIESSKSGWSWRLENREATLLGLKNIRLNVEGGESLQLIKVDEADHSTHVQLHTAVGDVTLPLLRVMSVGGDPTDLTVAPPALDGNQIVAPFAWPLAQHNSENSNIITAPDLIYGTFIGGADFDDSKSIAVDASGAAYVTGYAGTDMPTTPGAFDTSFGGGSYDAYVAKLSPDGDTAIYITYLGGNGDDLGHGIAVESDGSAVYVIGHAYSSNFPTTAGAFQSGYAGGSDAFVAKLNTDGSAPVYATYLGGGSWEQGTGIAVDASGNAYVIGTTKSIDFPTTPGSYDPDAHSNDDVFVAKLNASGSGLVYSTYLGGERWDRGFDIAVDSSGAAYATGDTYGYGFPTTPGAFDTTHSGSYTDAFVAKFTPDGSDLVYATLLSGSSGQILTSTGHGIAVTSDGTAYVTGGATSTNFPTTPGAFQTTRSGGYDVFLVRLNADGSDALYATYVGGGSHDVAKAVAVDDAGLVYLIGETGSTDWPTTAGALQPALASWTISYYDAFVAVLRPSGQGADDLLYSTYLGGLEDDQGRDIALHAASQTVYAAGFTTSEDFPVTADAYDPTYGGGYYGHEPYGDAFVLKLTPNLPRVTAVTPCIGGPFYFRPWPLAASNTYQAQIDWRGHTPDHVDFDLNGNKVQAPTSGDTATHALDLGDLDYGLLGERNNLVVQAVAGDGISSPPYTLSPIGVEYPVWLPVGSSQQEIPSGCSGQPMKVKGSITYPDPAFEAEVTPPDWFPFIGGSPFGIKHTQVGLEIELAGDSKGSAKLSGQTGFDAADHEITGRVSGQGTGAVSEGDGVRLEGVSFGLDLEGTVKAERSLADVICQVASGGTCPLEQAEDLPVVGAVVRWFNERAKFEATIQPGVNLTFNFEGGDSGLTWKDGTGTAKVKVTLALVLDAVKDLLTAEGYGGGEPSLTLQTPPNPSYLQKVTAKVFAGVKLKVWRWEQTFEAPYEWSYAPPGTPALAAKATSVFHAPRATGWHPIPRDYATNLSDYARFQGNDGRGPSTLQNVIGALASGESVIATNVFPDGHPDIASDGNPLLLWVHDDTGKPLMQGEEIYYSAYDGVSWSTPAGITDDNYQDFAPQVAFDQNGNAVAAWERNKTLQSASSEFDADYANAFELAYSVWSSGTQTWSAPAYLTDNSALDHAPLLAQGDDGTPLLVWRQNAAGELIGTLTDTDTLYYSLWDGSTWITPTALLTDVSGVLGVTAARHDANTMAVVYSQDTDGDLASDDDQELYRLTWNGSAWSGPTRLTNDAAPDNHPTLFYDSAGDPRLLWLKDDALYALLDGWAGTPQTITAEGSAAVMDYAAAQDAAGNLVLLWQGHSDAGVDIFYAAYDQAHATFSLVEQLTHDEPLEKFMAPTFGATGEMVLAYNKTSLATETVTVSSTLVISNVTTLGQTDLYVLSHTLGPDLALETSSLTIDPANPTPGSTARISVTLHNAGDQAVVNPQVAVYQGDPDAGGMLVDTATAALTLTGGMTTTLAVDWGVPAGGAPFAIYAVADPGASVAELNETNNKAHVYAAVSDLALTDMQVTYGSGQIVTLTATLNNVGVLTAAPITVAFRLEDPVSGAVVAQAYTPSLAAGAETEMGAAWDTTATPTGRYTLYAVADPDSAVTEADETNNTQQSSLGLLPDLVLRSTGVVMGTTSEGRRVASVWVFNTGARDAQGATLGVYDQLPKPGVTPWLSATLDVQAGGHRVTTFDLSSYLSPGFYLGVGIYSAMEDRDGNDNILLVGQVLPNRLYLPLVLRDQ